MTGGRCRSRHLAALQGFTLIELLVATGIVVIVTAITCRLAIAAQRATRADASRVEMQQRARVAADTLSRVLLDAGAGPSTGSAAGSLARFLPPVVPARIGRRSADPPGSFRTDALTVLSAVAESEAAALLLPLPAGGTAIELAPGCARPACGFAVGTQLVLFDTHGAYDLFTVLDVAGSALSLRHPGAGGQAYPAGSPVIAATATTIHLDAPARLLRAYDTDASDLPLLDDVVGFEVRYFGSRAAPVRPRARPGSSNCLYDAAGGFRTAFLPVFDAVNGSEAELAARELTDGPWCGGGASQFDADLLRIRRVRIVIRLQATDASMRGADARRFRRAGSATDSAADVPDLAVTVDIALRNLRADW